MTGLPAQDATTLAALRADIEAHGILVPVIKTPDGGIIDGHTRLRIAAELGIEAPELVVEVANPLATGLALNSLRRSLTREQQRAVFATLRELGHSNREIARMAGVHGTTVGRALASAPAAAPAAPGGKSTPSELARRRHWVARQWRAGYATADIRAALGGLAESALNNDLQLTVGKRPRRYSSRPGLPALQPFDWHDEAAQPPAPTKGTPPYKLSPTLRMWEANVNESRNSHHANRLAGDAADAEDAGDEAWLRQAEQIMRNAREEVSRLLDVIVDVEARMRGIREQADDGRPLLRVLP